MKKVLFLSAVACSIAFYACKKDDKTTTPTPVTDTVATIDPVALSNSIKVGYGGTSIKGSIPAASTDAAAPILDSIYSGLTYYAVSNRYIIIKPRILDGYIAGYYLKIDGADAYFKIDYAAAKGVRKAPQKGHSSLREGDNSDSTIIIKLPDNVLGDTFQIKYAAYDTLNRVSNTITAIVSVSASAKPTDNDTLLGNWTLVREKEQGDENWYNETDSSFDAYACVDNVLEYCESEVCLQIPTYLGYNTYTLNFAASNNASTTNSYYQKRLNMETSTCSSLQYDASYQSGVNTRTGGYSYNSATKKLTVIYETNDATNLYSETYDVTEISSTKLAMYKAVDEQSNHDILRINYYEFTKAKQ
jgi:hypothetical protein